jgi:hypothetical protein
MNTSSRAAFFLGFSVFGASACTAILGGFDFDGTGTGTGGAGTTGTMSSSGATTSTTASGTGGAEAGPPPPSCTGIGSTFSILAPTDFGANATDTLFVVADPGTGSGSVAHVVAASRNSGTLFARSVRLDNQTQLGPVVSFGAGMLSGMSCSQPSDCMSMGPASCVGGKCLVAQESFGAVAVWVSPGHSLNVQGHLATPLGTQAPGIGELAFPVDPTKQEFVQATPAPSYTPWPTPSDCQAGGWPNTIVVTPPSNGVTRYGVTCSLMGSGNAASLWVAASDGSLALTKLGQGVGTDPQMNPAVYAYVGNQHFFGFQTGGGAGLGPGGYAYGSDPTMVLASYTKFALATGQYGLPMGLYPLPTNDGFAFFIASIDPGLAAASLWGGAVHPADYATLGQTPPPSLQSLVSVSSATDLSNKSALQGPVPDAKTLYMAAPTFGKTAVNLSWTRRDGTPLALEAQIYSSMNATCMSSHTCNTVLAASAAPIGIGQVLVAWAEQTVDSPPKYTVNGLSVLCTGD